MRKVIYLWGRKYCLINTMPGQVILYFFLEILRQFCVSFNLIYCEPYEFQHSVSSDVSHSLLFFEILTCYGIYYYTLLDWSTSFAVNSLDLSSFTDFARLKYLISCYFSPLPFQLQLWYYTGNPLKGKACHCKRCFGCWSSASPKNGDCHHYSYASCISQWEHRVAGNILLTLSWVLGIELINSYIWSINIVFLNGRNAGCFYDVRSFSYRSLSEVFLSCIIIFIYLKPSSTYLYFFLLGN